LFEMENLKRAFAWQLLPGNFCPVNFCLACGSQAISCNFTCNGHINYYPGFRGELILHECEGEFFQSLYKAALDIDYMPYS
jgi:hypothetical protein